MGMIETYNESGLHRSLKMLYTERFKGKTEQEIEGKVCDVVTGDGEIIEIQTGSLSKLALKIARLVPNHKVRVVYPLVKEKWIETRDEGGQLISKRRSPKKAGTYSIFRELTGIYPWVLHEHFILELLEVKVLEKRIRTEKPMQLANKSRRFPRNWYKTDKELLSIEDSRTLAGPASYLALLPFSPEDVFSVKALASLQDASGQRIGKNAPLAIWVLQKMRLIELAEKRSNTKYYRLLPGAV
jgi:hypothetical protein